MDIKIIEILEDNVSLDWQRFSRCSEFTDECSINAIIKYINDDEFVDKNNKSKLRSLLKILYEHHPEDYKKYIVDSLKHIKRNDVLKDLSNLGLSNISVALKHFYIQTYEKVDELQPPLKTPASVSISKKFVDLCIVDPIEVNINTIYSDERMNYLKKQMSYKPIPYNEVFMKEKSLLLISGIAGIGKSWLLRKCLIDWANNLIWKNVGFVFFFECRRLNQYQNISNINELLDFFYKDFVNDLNINNHNVIFMIDGLDEFKYLNDLINYNSSSQYPIVNVLAEIQKYKSVVAGRVYAIDQYLNVCWMAKGHNEKLAIQIMGFNQNGINNYIELNVIDEVKDAIKVVFKQSPIVKAMASVPFYLSCMCKIIANSEQRIKFSLLTMTDLYASIFLYFIQKHISKKDLPMYEMMIINSNREYIFNICKIAYQFFVENKVIFSKDEIQTFFSDCNKVEVELFGFIERIETNLGYHYQFAHMTIMEFCVSVYAYNNFSGEEIIDNDKLKSCLPMICGLINKSQKSLMKFLVNLNNSNKEKISMAHICSKYI
ncbi:NACHT, LRR and PYD domains-containing protein 9 isoform X2 [Hydra vulgaris]|nr:NACHT, LRR and PYD domains-containing protein 9 isoform X2 [Hydra vulgaris]XP_047140353.1 NACHT, LRR and PYD domains-containing protein 9 isoform X2 [Hydra vulgaris]XP_047140354.1 NACHT, LRR and PYD domains-containing protein 9 isoform X2 [Hydra vulgaris]